MGDTPDTAEQIVVDLPGKQLRTLIYHLRTEFPMTDALCAKGFPPRWGAFALTEALRGLYHNDLVTPLDEHIALARASAPLTDWADWPQTRRNIAASHGTPLHAGRTQTTAAWLSGIIHSLTQPNYGNLVALLPGVQHPPDMNAHLHPQISGVIRV